MGSIYVHWNPRDAWNTNNSLYVESSFSPYILSMLDCGCVCILATYLLHIHQHGLTGGKRLPAGTLTGFFFSKIHDLAGKYGSGWWKSFSFSMLSFSSPYMDNIPLPKYHLWNLAYKAAIPFADAIGTFITLGAIWNSHVRFQRMIACIRKLHLFISRSLNCRK